MNRKSVFKNVSGALVALALLINFSFTASANTGVAIGEVAVAKGVATARSDTRQLTALAKGEPVYVGDILETAARSFLVVKFSDGGKITLRPDSRFNIEEYDDTPGQEKESFKLIKGGLRAVTGAIGKNRPQEVSYKAKNTTIGIRGTTFVIKICEPGTDGCASEQNNEELTAEQKSELVDIFVVDKNGGKREQITRQSLLQFLDGVFVNVVEGGIRVDLGEQFFDMGAGDSCLVEGAGSVQCFLAGIDFSTADIYVSGDAESLSNFNLLGDDEVAPGDEICEIE